jgi:hypothetical protein
VHVAHLAANVPTASLIAVASPAPGIVLAVPKAQTGLSLRGARFTAPFHCYIRCYIHCATQFLLG